MTIMASKHRTRGHPSPPTAGLRKQDIFVKEQQTMEPVEMDFSMTAQIREMDFSMTAQIREMDFSTAHIAEMHCSEYTTKKQVEMDFSVTSQEPVEQV